MSLWAALVALLTPRPPRARRRGSVAPSDAAGAGGADAGGGGAGGGDSAKDRGGASVEERQRVFLGQLLNAFFAMGVVLWSLATLVAQSQDAEMDLVVNPWLHVGLGVVGYAVTKWTQYQRTVAWVLMVIFAAYISEGLLDPVPALSQLHAVDENVVALLFVGLSALFALPLMVAVVLLQSDRDFSVVAAVPVVVMVVAQATAWSSHAVVQFGLLVYGFVLFFVQGFRRYLFNELDSHKQIGDSAQQASTLKSEFLANITHELRTPLNGMIGLLDLVRETNLTAVQDDYLTTCTKSCEELMRLVNQLLDIAKIEEGKLALDMTDFDLRELLLDTVDLLSSRVRKGVELMAYIDPSLPPRVHGDPGRIRQMLTNFLGNAVKFTKDGYILVRLTILATSPGSPSGNGDAGGAISRRSLTHPRLQHPLKVQVSVEDTGIGVSKEDLAKLFHRFQQAKDPQAKAMGTGLGLAISKQFAMLMNGEVGAESKKGRGSDFWFTFRVTVPAPVGLDARSVPYTSDASQLIIPQIVLVHPDRRVGVLMSHMLSLSPYNVRVETRMPEPPTAAHSSIRSAGIIYIVEEEALLQTGLSLNKLVKLYPSPILRLCSLQEYVGSTSVVPTSVRVMRKPVSNNRLQQEVDRVAKKLFALNIPEEEDEPQTEAFGKTSLDLMSGYGSLHNTARILVVKELREWVLNATQQTLVQVTFVSRQAFARSAVSGEFDLGIIGGHFLERLGNALASSSLPLLVVLAPSENMLSLGLTDRLRSRCVATLGAKQPVHERQLVLDRVLTNLGFRMIWAPNPRRQSQDDPSRTLSAPLAASITQALAEGSDLRNSTGDIAPLTPKRGSQGPMASLRILVVDDNAVNRKLMKGMLGSLKQEVLLAESGRVALDVVRREFQTIDLVFMDCQMPDIDGLEATREIRQFEKDNSLPRITIVALTADNSEAAREESQRVGMDLYMSKPVRKKQLADMIDDILKLRAPPVDTTELLDMESRRESTG